MPVEQELTLLEETQHVKIVILTALIVKIILEFVRFVLSGSNLTDKTVQLARFILSLVMV